MANSVVYQTAVKNPAFDLKTFAVVTITVISWASAFAGIRAGLQSYAPEQVALLRYATASVVLLIIALRNRIPLPQRRDLLPIIALGFTGFTFYNIVLNAGEKDTPAAVASLIVASAPIFVALLAKTFLREQLTAWAWIGIAICFSGVTVIAFKSGTQLEQSPSALLILAAAIAQSTYTTFQKPLLKTYRPLQFTTYAIWVGTIFLLPFTPGLIQQMQTASLSSTLAVIYMGVFPGALGYVCWSYVLSRLPAARAGVFLYIVPPTAALIAWAWLGELPTLLTIIGGVLVLCGVIVVNTYGQTRRQVSKAN
jgi:drug/metabolite transporter (DMT)-like permease